MNKVFNTKVEPHWFAGGDRFWYRTDRPEEAHEFIVVDAVGGKRETAFDHGKLAAELAKVSGRTVKGTHLPFDRIEIDGDVVRFAAPLSAPPSARTSRSVSSPSRR